MAGQGAWARWLERAQAPVDGASLAAFRFLFGMMGAFGSVRFLVNGWVEPFFFKPTFFFKYWGFGWLDVPPPWALYGAFGALAVLGVGIAVGAYYRLCAVAFFVLFTYVELLDVTNYLNHYYLVSVLGFVLCWLPLDRVWSVDARRNPSLRRATLPAWVLWVVRFQVGVVYVGAALAKATPDWLLHAQPMHAWLSARGDMPLLGPWFGEWWVALAMSWAGFLYDLTIVGWLSWERTRLWAYGVLLVFHAMTKALFMIGMFPFLMTGFALAFFGPSWPRRVLPGRWVRALDGASEGVAGGPTGPREAALWARPWVGRAVVGVLALHLSVQALLPLRAYAYGGEVLWHEQGMRWSWRVMCREKNGSAMFRVKLPGQEREKLVPPRHYLTRAQEREMSSQPDLILQMAQHIARDWERQGFQGVEVRVDALASLNGRPAARLIDPSVDLARVQDGVLPASWILPAPQGAPSRAPSRSRLAAALGLDAPATSQPSVYEP